MANERGKKSAASASDFSLSVFFSSLSLFLSECQRQNSKKITLKCLVLSQSKAKSIPLLEFLLFNLCVRFSQPKQAFPPLIFKNQRMGVLKDFDCTVIRKDQAVEVGSEKYNIINPGLSYLGICRERGCEALGRSVVCNRGHGSHLVNEDIMMENVKCPCCRKPFVMETIALFCCTATVVAHHQQEETTAVEAKGMEIVKFGAKNSQKLNLQGVLVTVTTKAHGTGSGCSIC